MVTDSIHTSGLRRELEAIRAKHEAQPNRVHELEIARLEKALDISEKRDTSWAQAASDSEDEAKQRDDQARAELEQQLMADYRRAAPGTTEAEARAALPDLLHRHRLSKMSEFDAQVAKARARGGYAV